MGWGGKQVNFQFCEQSRQVIVNNGDNSVDITLILNDLTAYQHAHGPTQYRP